MSMKIFNTLTRKKEEFKPLDEKEIRMYSCGPTVYYFAHIGNLRAYLFMDNLRRVLKYNGYDTKKIKVNHNISGAVNELLQTNNNKYIISNYSPLVSTINILKELGDR